MYDVKWIRDNPEAFDDGLRRRGLAPSSDTILALDEDRRGLVTRLQAARSAATPPPRRSARPRRRRTRRAPPR